MTPLLVVGILVTVTSSLADVKHVLEQHASTPSDINNLATKNFWWMNQDSPLKHAYDYYKKCQLKGNCAPPVKEPAPEPAPLPPCAHNQPAGFAQPQVQIQLTPDDLSSNPFLRGNVPQTNVQYHHEGAAAGAPIDLSKNPFFNQGNTLIAANGAQIGKTGGFLGVQPSQPTFPKPFPTTHPLDTKKPFSTKHPLDEKKGEPCKGAGFLCVPKEQCINGVVNNNGEGLIQVRSSVQYCKDNEICCHYKKSGITLPEIDVKGISAGKSSIPQNLIKFFDGAGFSSGTIQVLPNPNVLSDGETGSNHFGASTSKPVRETNDNAVSANSISPTIDYSDTKFGDVRFASTIQGPAYLPPIGGPTPPTNNVDLEVPNPGISTYRPSIPTSPRPQPSYYPSSTVAPTTEYLPPSPSSPQYVQPSSPRPNPFAQNKPSQSPSPSQPSYQYPSSTPSNIPQRPSAPGSCGGYPCPSPSPQGPSTGAGSPYQPSRPTPSPFQPQQPSPSPAPQRPSYGPSKQPSSPSQPQRPKPTPSGPGSSPYQPQQPSQPSRPTPSPYQPSTPGYKYPKPTPPFSPQRPSQPTPAPFQPQRPSSPYPSSPSPSPPYQPSRPIPGPAPVPQQPSYQPSPSPGPSYQPSRPTSSPGGCTGFSCPSPSAPGSKPFQPQQPSYQPSPSPGPSYQPSRPTPTPGGCTGFSCPSPSAPGSTPFKPQQPSYQPSPSPGPTYQPSRPTSSPGSSPFQPQKPSSPSQPSYPYPGPSSPVPSPGPTSSPFQPQQPQRPSSPYQPGRPSTPFQPSQPSKPTQGPTAPGYEYPRPTPPFPDRPSQPQQPSYPSSPSRPPPYQPSPPTPGPTPAQPGCTGFSCPAPSPSGPQSPSYQPSPSPGPSYQPSRPTQGPYQPSRPTPAYPSPAPFPQSPSSPGYEYPRPTPSGPPKPQQPYQPSQPSRPQTPSYQPSPSPGPSYQPSRPTQGPYQPSRPTPSYPSPSPFPQSPSTPGYEYPRPSPSGPPKPQQPYQPSQPSRPPPSNYPSPYKTPSPPSPSPGYSPAYQPSRPTPSSTVPQFTKEYLPPAPTPGGYNPNPSQSDTNQQYLFPPQKSTERPQPSTQRPRPQPTTYLPPSPTPDYEGSNTGGNGIRLPLPSDQNPAVVSSCAAALKCVEESYCSAEGVISDTPVVLTKEQELLRVPTTTCTIPESGAEGRCCRDSNYQDPWPSANLVNGVDDGQYAEDDSLGQYNPGQSGARQRPSRASVGGPRQDSSSVRQQTVPSDETCGVRHPNGRPKGEGPLDVTFAEIPWQAMILRDTNRSLLCGGAIIRRNAVLTAAHCVEGLETRDILIKGGEWKLGIDEEPLPFQIVKVAAIARHPQYQKGSLQNDLAVLVLKEKLRLAKNIGTICLPSTNQIPTTNCIATGWGKRILQLHARGALMRSISVNVMDSQQCQDALNTSFQKSLSNYNPNTLCGFSEIDQCKVDYGSALACSADGGAYTLSGIFSWDTGCRQQGQIGGYVAPDVEWIQHTLAQPLGELKKLDRQYAASFTQ